MEDLEEDAKPEDLMLSYVSGEKSKVGSQEKLDRKQLVNRKMPPRGALQYACCGYTAAESHVAAASSAVETCLDGTVAFR